MVGTRASIKESERIFQKVILDNLGEKSSGDIWQALQQDGIHTFADLGTLTFSDVDELKNTVSTETEQGTQTSIRTLTRGERGWIKALIAFIKHTDVVIEKDYEEKFTKDSFSYFRRVDLVVEPSLKDNTSKSSQKNSNQVQQTKQYISQFKKNIKRDKSQYNSLTEDKQWDSWNRSTRATARTHDCDEIFDPSYTPRNGDEHQLFLEKQYFM